MKHKLIMIAIALSLFVGLSFNVDAKRINGIDDFFAADYANILTDEAKQEISAKNIYYEDKYEDKAPQVVVMTLPKMTSDDIESESTRIFEQQKIGSEKYDNGILILYDLNTNKVRIEVGYGMEGSIPDGMAGMILDASLEDIKANDKAAKSRGLLNVFRDVMTHVDSDIAEGGIQATKASAWKSFKYWIMNNPELLIFFAFFIYVFGVSTVREAKDREKINFYEQNGADEFLVKYGMTWIAFYTAYMARKRAAVARAASRGSGNIGGFGGGSFGGGGSSGGGGASR